MRRRDFIGTPAGSLLPAPFAAEAQRAEKVYRVGMLERTSPATNAANLAAFRRGLREPGYVDGKNFVLEYRSAEGRDERFADLAAELVRLNVDLIVTRGTPAAPAAKDRPAVPAAARGSSVRVACGDDPGDRSLTPVGGRAILPATTNRPARAERRRRHLLTGEQGDST